MGINTVSILIYKQSCRTNPSGYSIKMNTDRNTFVLTAYVVGGMVSAVLRRTGEICLSFPTREYYMKHFGITNTSGYSSLEGLAAASFF
jgi:hypothetical protein